MFIFMAYCSLPTFLVELHSKNLWFQLFLDSQANFLYGSRLLTHMSRMQGTCIQYSACIHKCVCVRMQMQDTLLKTNR